VDLRGAAGSSEIRFRQVETFSDHKGNISPEKKKPYLDAALVSRSHSFWSHNVNNYCKEIQKTRHFKTKFCIR